MKEGRKKPESEQGRYPFLATFTGLALCVTLIKKRARRCHGLAISYLGLQMMQTEATPKTKLFSINIHLPQEFIKGCHEDGKAERRKIEV